MEQPKNNIESLVDDTTDIIHAYRDLAVIRIVEFGSQGMSISIIGILSLFVTGFVLLFIGLGAAWWIGQSLGDLTKGFFIVGGVYTIMLIILLLTIRTVWLPFFRNVIIRKIYEQDR